ncbi:MAG TPA: carboxymuconolactone decarboxylase family protein, partial [Trebonia sp.]|nr:carboxymuconolactone decarboxylase family protein [Trebonia sp.]
MELAQVLLRGDSTLTAGERELIAAYVSRQNECEYCAGSHGATAAALLPGGGEQVAAVLAGAAGDAAVLDGEAGDASVSAKLRALLDIAALVRVDGRLVSAEAVAAARAEGATDLEIHDTVLIAAAFCMFNRYVDGL